jgi:hypothetical protein
MSLMLRRVIAPAAVWLAAAVSAHAQPTQQPMQQPAGPPPVSQGNPVCARLETQLQTFDRGSADAGRAEQVRKFEDAAAGQQNELDRQEATARRMGCNENAFFALFSGGQPQQCGPLNSKISQMRANLDRINADLERLRSDSGPERDGQRRAILVALSQNNCGQQYRAAVAAAPPPRSGGLFESLFGPGPGSILAPGGDSGWSAPGGTYRTVCVRTCDGFFYPISFATNASRFGDDEKSCQKSCPAAEVQLYSHRNPGEDINQAVSVNGSQPYTALPNAFKYRQSWDNSCSCRKSGESWAQTLKNMDDTTVEQGDIVVNEQRAKQLSQPRIDAQGKPIPAAAPARAAPRQAAAPTPAQAAPPSAAPANTAAPTAGAANAAPAEPPQPVKPDPNRTIRAVGPTFIPAR